MTDAAVSRRGLFTAALARIRVPDEPVDPGPSSPRRSPAWGHGDSGGLLDGPSAHIAAMLATLPARVPVLVAGTGDPALRRLLRARDLAVTEVHETLPPNPADAVTHAPLSRLPFADASFGAVVSACGPMFARDAPTAHAELLRVARRSAPVVITAWSGSGAVGRLLGLVARHLDCADGRPSPLTWGREERLRQDLDGFGVQYATDLVDVGTAVPRHDAARHLLAGLGAPSTGVLPTELVDEAEGLAERLVSRVAGDPARLRSRMLVVRVGGPWEPAR